jgi:hypothetical protein
MPAVSKKQRRAMAIAEHHPEKLMKKNKGMAKMSKSQLHDFAATKEKGMPMKKGKGKMMMKGKAVMKGKGKTKRQMADAMTK